MEAAIRWSPHSTQHDPRFLIIDVVGNRLRLCQIDHFAADKPEFRRFSSNKVEYRQLCIRDKLPNYTAFDWSKKDAGLVGIGAASGEAHIVQLDPDKPDGDFLHAFPIRHQRKCNSIAFSNKNLLATGLDRVRNDVCLNIYDLNDARFTSKDEPYKKLASSEAISSIKFFTGQPDMLIAGVSRQYVRIYDLRDPNTMGIAQFQSKQVHNIAIDPLDENYFLSAGAASDPTVSVWDQRYVKQRSNSGDSAGGGAVLEFKPVVDTTHPTSIWSLRYTGTKKGTFGVLSNTGELKVVEMAQHAHRFESLKTTADSSLARAWSSQHYTKASHHLSYPYYHKGHLQNEKDRVIAFDFMTTGSPLGGQCALALHSNREVEVLKVPATAPRIGVTALEEVYKGRTCIAKPSSRQGTVASDLSNIQNKALSLKHERHLPLPEHLSSAQNHEEQLKFAYPDVEIPLADYLSVLQAPKRRAQEGYSLGCAQNRTVVANDPWLIDVWTFVERMDTHAWGDGMVGNGLELNYLGIDAIWANELAMYDERRIDPDAKISEAMFRDAVREITETKDFPPFDGVRTEYPENRQLCLSLCGWPLDKKGVQDNCENLVQSGELYKAIVLAVFQGHKDIAQSLLRSALQQGKLPQDHIGLGAVIACASPSSGVPAEQRDACAWMADMTTDPYLKSLLTYFITGDWTAVVDMKQLNLTDRVAAALKYFPDTALSSFISVITAQSIREGSISGIILTGLTTRTLDLLQVYVSKHPSELQTAVLLLSRACPLYIQDPRWYLWKEIYLNDMQVWRAFLERTRYIKEHNLRSVNRDGKSVNKPSQPSIAIRCTNCNQNLALRKEVRSGSSKPKAPGAPVGKHGAVWPALRCPDCGAQMPRCGICMMWLGSPDPSKPGTAETLKGEDLESRLMVFCMNCTHGFHGHHARDWFARHSMCPVPDCGCMCGLLK